jgi:hypothetical protein
VPIPDDDEQMLHIAGDEDTKINTKRIQQHMKPSVSPFSIAAHQQSNPSAPQALQRSLDNESIDESMPFQIK